jgi:deazaflavin-dependent oxidoreductase (nitroreductase family)
MQLMRTFVNPVVRALLRSPLQRLVPGVMLISVTGRRSGRTIATPVQYVRRDEQVYVLTRAHRQWWRNLLGGAPVELRLRGRTLRGVGTAYQAGAPEAAAGLAAFRGSSLERAAGQLGEQAVVVAIALEEDR